MLDSETCRRTKLDGYREKAGKYDRDLYWVSRTCNMLAGIKAIQWLMALN